MDCVSMAVRGFPLLGLLRRYQHSGKRAVHAPCAARPGFGFFAAGPILFFTPALFPECAGLPRLPSRPLFSRYFSRRCCSRAVPRLPGHPFREGANPPINSCTRHGFRRGFVGRASRAFVSPRPPAGVEPASRPTEPLRLSRSRTCVSRTVAVAWACKSGALIPQDGILHRGVRFDAPQPSAADKSPNARPKLSARCRVG